MIILKLKDLFGESKISTNHLGFFFEVFKLLTMTR